MQKHLTKEQIIRSKTAELFFKEFKEKLEVLSKKEYIIPTSDGKGSFTVETLADGAIYINVEPQKFEFKGNLGSAIQKWLMSLVIRAVIKMVNITLSDWHKDRMEIMGNIASKYPELKNAVRSFMAFNPATRSEENSQDTDSNEESEQVSPEAVSA